ncbi:MAG: hypothetical protein KZQ93_15315 [Candidatus Thiodiazotropha sp. (ex Monitilora ramsayi)]|nr:hypothetical protein [Candidatus Thiodiazotropha sp. (ex Monitilora ramsayi)]
MYKYISTVPLLLAISACASLSGNMQESTHQINIDKIDSRSTKIGMVSLQPEETGLWVRGEVARKIPMRGPIFGHVHIDVFGENATKLVSLIANHQRPNRQALNARFSKQIPVEPDRVKRVEITHHPDRHCQS